MKTHLSARLAFLAAFGILAACAQSPLPPSSAGTPSAPALPTPDTCNAARYAGLIGQNSTALEKTLILGQVRVLRPNTPMTLDLRPERINFHFNDNDRITRISCV